MRNLIVFLGAGLLLISTAFASVPEFISGNYVEVRSNEVYTCGCLYSGQRVTAGTEAIVVWDIRQGSYLGTPLGGTRIAAVLVSDATVSDQENPRESTLYVDTRLSGADPALVVQLAREKFGQLLGQIVAVHQAPIELERVDDRISVKVGEESYIVVKRARLPEDAHPGSSRWYEPFVPLRNPSLATTLHYEYRGKDFGRQWREVSPPTISGYFGSFEISVR